MSLIYLQRLIDELEKGRQFPPNRELRYRQQIELFAAIRESDAEKLKPNWWDVEYEENRGYVIDPLGERISAVWSDMLWGEEPQIEPAVKADTKQLEDWVDDNDLPESLPWAEEIRSSEGEVWARHVVEPSINSVQLEWHSRLNVIPVYVGRKLVAAAIFSVLEYDEDTKKAWVYVEYHTDGYLTNRLYNTTLGSNKNLGDPVDLGSRAETAEIQPEWKHDEPMLLTRIPNKLGRDWRCGISDLKGVAGLLLSLNEITNIGQENARLTAKQKVVVPQRFLDSKGRLPRGAEVIIASEVDADPDKIKNDFAMIEWEFDADAIIKYKDSLTDVILTRARVAPQLVGRHTETAQTGPALRARLVDTILAGNRKGKAWDDKLPELISRGAVLEKKVFGKGWTSPQKEPVVKRKSALPEDEESKSRRIVTEVNAKIRARKTAIEELNPTWGPARVQEELDLLEEDWENAEVTDEPFIPNSAGDRVPDPASTTARSPGQRKPSTNPDPQKKIRT